MPGTRVPYHSKCCSRVRPMFIKHHNAACPARIDQANTTEPKNTEQKIIFKKHTRYYINLFILLISKLRARNC